MSDEVPADAHELLSPEAVEHWTTSGARFGDDFPPEIEPMRPWVEGLRQDGLSEIEIACAFARMVRLAREEDLGLIERVTQPDGSAVILNRRAVSRPHLFAAARELIGDEEPRGPALVVAQAAVEVGFETAIDFAMQMRLTYDPLHEWVISAPVRSWSPNNHNVQLLWSALTGNTITQAASWKAYKEGLKWRDAFVHRLSGVPREQAEGFVDAAEQLVKHVVQVLADTFPDPVESP